MGFRVEPVVLRGSGDREVSSKNVKVATLLGMRCVDCVGSVVAIGGPRLSRSIRASQRTSQIENDTPPNNNMHNLITNEKL